MFYAQNCDYKSCSIPQKHKKSIKNKGFSVKNLPRKSLSERGKNSPGVSVDGTDVPAAKTTLLDGGDMDPTGLIPLGRYKMKGREIAPLSFSLKDFLEPLPRNAEEREATVLHDNRPGRNAPPTLWFTGRIR